MIPNVRSMSRHRHDRPRGCRRTSLVDSPIPTRGVHRRWPGSGTPDVLPVWAGSCRCSPSCPWRAAFPTTRDSIGALVLDDRMPSDRKVLLGAAAGYLVMGATSFLQRAVDRWPRRHRRGRARRRRLPRRRAARVAPGEARGPRHRSRLVRPRRRPDPTLDARTRSSDHPATPRPCHRRRTCHRPVRDRAARRAWITKEEPST